MTNAQKPKSALLAAFVLLVGISSTDAALCSATAFAGTVTTCDCPAGTAPTGSFSSALPTGVYGGATAGVAGRSSQLTKANTALALCVDLLPGFKTAAVADTVLPIPCVIADGYCPGFPDAFLTGTAAANVIITTLYDGSYTTPTFTGTFVDQVGSSALAFLQKTQPIPCPANSGGANTAATASAAGASSTGQVAPFTLDKCKVTAGFYVAAAAGTATATVSQCPVNKACPTGTHAGMTTVESAPVTCVAAAVGNAASTVGGFICPVKTYGTLSTTLAGSLTGITGEIVCGVGSGPKADGLTCDVLAGYYGATSAVGTGTPSTTPAQTACPAGISGAVNEATLSAACVKAAPGYTILTDIPAQVAPGPITALTTGITLCVVSSYCPGGGTIAITGTSESLATYAAVAALAGADVAVACPAGIGNTVTGAISEATACIDLLPGYAFAASIGARTTVADLVVKCAAANEYNCAGTAGFFIDYSAAANTMPAGTGLTATASMVLSSGAFPANVQTAASGSMIQTACVNSKASASGGPISICLTNPGYYVDHSSLLLAAICPIGKYCAGGAPLGTAGGDSMCPAGSSLLGATGVVTNSNINECILSAGFYIAAAALTTPIPCPSATICAGGGAVGIAGGSVACPSGSLHASCSSAATTTTVSLTPASQPITVDVAAPVAAASPAVTVTNTVPSASSAASTVASLVVVTVAAMVAL